MRLPGGTGGPPVRRDILLEQGTVEYFDHGAGPTVVLLHGILTNAHLWDALSARLPGVRIVRPFLPLGSHARALPPGTDLTPAGVARLVAAFMDALALEDVTLVGNDTGGVVTQLLMAHHPQRLGRVVLTNTDAFENFLPPIFRPLQWAGHVPPLLHLLRVLELLPAAERLPFAFGRLTERPLPPALLRAFIAPSRDAGVRRDLARVLRNVDARVTLDVARLLPQFTRPVLIVWGEDDRAFPLAYGHALAHLLPAATLRRVPGRTFHMLDHPDALAAPLREFIGT